MDEKNSTTYIRPITLADTELVVKWRNNPRVVNNFIFSEKLTEEMHIKWINEKVKKGVVEQFIVVEKKTEKEIGSVYFRDIDKKNNTCEYGIFIGEDDAIGKGYGNEIAKMALEYAFKNMLMKTIFLRVFEDNIVAIKSYKRAGFVRIEGKEEVVNKDGVDRKIIFMKYEREKKDE